MNDDAVMVSSGVLKELKRKALEYDSLVTELEKSEILRDACLGCGRFYHEKDCGCSAGSYLKIDNSKIIKKSEDPLNEY